MNLRDEFLEFIHDRWTQVVTKISVPLIVISSIYSIIAGRLDIFWLGIYSFVVLFILLNAVYVLVAKEKLPAIEVPGKGSKARSIAKYSLLLPYAMLGLVAAILLIPFFGFVAPFRQPVDIFMYGTPSLTPTITSTPTQTPTQTLTSTSTVTLTPTATGTPRVQGVYYMIVLDASANMTEAFDGKPKWDAALESVTAILEGLEPGAKYGLVVVGGTPSAEDVDACNEPSAVKNFFSIRKNVSDQMAHLQPVGGGSLDTAFVLARNQFEGLPHNTIHVLLYITGAKDACASRDEWQELERLFKTRSDAAADVDSEIIILDQDSGFDAQSVAQRLDGLSENVNVQSPQNLAELQQSNKNVIANVRSYITTTVASLVTNTPTATSTITLTPKPGTPTLTPSITVTPSMTATLGVPTTIFTWTPTITPVTPSSTAVSPASVELLTVTYVTENVGCQIDVQVRVTGGPATGTFHVRNDSYTPGDSTTYPQTTLQVGTNWASLFSLGNMLTLSGDKPAFYNHEVWFEYNGVQSNHLKNLFCPGIPPPS